MSDPNSPKATGQFLTASGRWKQCMDASGLERLLTRKELGLANAMFMAGFAAALEATQEIAALPERDAIQLLAYLHIEIATINAAFLKHAAGAPGH